MESPHVLQIEFFPEKGEELFALACEKDLEGIVGKWARACIRATADPPWIKVKNLSYSQAEGRAELFESKRGTTRPWAPKLVLR